MMCCEMQRIQTGYQDERDHVMNTLYVYPMVFSGVTLFCMYPPSDGDFLTLINRS